MIARLGVAGVVLLAMVSISGCVSSEKDEPLNYTGFNHTGVCVPQGDYPQIAFGIDIEGLKKGQSLTVQSIVPVKPIRLTVGSLRLMYVKPNSRLLAETYPPVKDGFRTEWEKSTPAIGTEIRASSRPIEVVAQVIADGDGDGSLEAFTIRYVSAGRSYEVTTRETLKMAVGSC